MSRNPTALSVSDLADLLRSCGATHCTVQTLEADLAAGAPVNKDGTVSLLPFGAWMVRDLLRGPLATSQ